MAALSLYEITGDRRYLACFIETLRWIADHQADGANGGWHATILPDGTTRGDKANAWKGPYHEGRAVIRCIEILDRMAKERRSR